MNVFVMSLGCDKNRVDTENMLYLLIKKGFVITDKPEDADIAIINTCSFIESSVKESLDNIFSINKLKSGKLKKLVVTGCLTARYHEQLTDMLPEVDLFFGISDYTKLADALVSDCGRKYYNDRSDMPLTDRTLSTPEHYAYLKIAEGCNNFCSYCTIPFIRGRYRSRTPESLIKECRELERYNIKELILVAQDITNYGNDLFGKPSLTDLLKTLSCETSFDKFRLLYCYPELVSDELIDYVSGSDRIFNYMDIPLQHISDSVLKAMGRRTDKASIETLFDKLKSKGINVRTTFIVGFPGETDEDFAELVEFVNKYKPVRAGVFKYSREDGTKAAKMKQVPAKIKNERYKVLTAVINKNIMEFTLSNIGRTLNVIYEGIDYKRNMFYGRTEFDAPDIDCRVYFSGAFCDIGNVYRVKITGNTGFDLIGKVEE